jgi:hypothetical protein
MSISTRALIATAMAVGLITTQAHAAAKPKATGEYMEARCGAFEMAAAQSNQNGWCTTYPNQVVVMRLDVDSEYEAILDDFRPIAADMCESMLDANGKFDTSDWIVKVFPLKTDAKPLATCGKKE